MTRSEKLRAAIYALAAAILGILGVYGVVTDEAVGAWLLIVTTAVPVLALLNVPGFRNRTGEPDTPESP